MSELEIVSQGYKKLFGIKSFKISLLPQSGSDRKYFRIIDDKKSVIGAFNANADENEAFIGFSRHFFSKGLPVPEIYGYIPEKYVYFIQDLGDTNLFTWLRQMNPDGGFNLASEKLYHKILDHLIHFQVEGISGLDLSLCYPHRSFDRQSMMWDMNYFKYMFLKLIAVTFNEKRLEHNFELLADFLLETGQNYFLYRDFQSANVMIVEGEPVFIDYQGGRKGAPQYDVASLLYDAKAHIPQSVRNRLLGYYEDKFCSISGESKEKFTAYFTGFSLIRIMQALGAFGFRGLYEKKPTFTESIVPAVKLLLEIINETEQHIKLTELYDTIRSVPESKMFIRLSEKNH